MNAFSSLEASVSKPKAEDQQSSLPQNCDFMKYLQPSAEAIHSSQQNAEQYEDIYQTLSSGVYESSDALEPDQQHEQDEEIVQENKKDYEEVYDEVAHHDQTQEAYPVLENNAVKNEQQTISYIQIVDEAQKQYEKVQTVTQNARITNLQQNKIQTQQPNTSEMEKNEQLRDEHKHNQEIYDKPVEKQMLQQNEKLQRIEQYEEAWNVQNDPITQKAMESSIHIYVDESITLPEQEQQLKQLQKSQIKQIERHETFDQPKFVKPEPPRLQFKSIQVHLQKFSNHFSHEDVKISIIGYEQEYFLKIQTQNFKIEVMHKDKQYVIKRRFSQFLTLQKLIRHYYPGYILYPFPEKSIQFFTKLKLSIGNQQEKIIIIEKRLFQLQRYLNFLISHRQISTSIILQIFLEQSSDIFQKETSNLLSIMQEQEKELQLGVIEQNYNNIKKLMKSGFSFINSYLTLSSANNDVQANLKDVQTKSKKNNELFDTIRIQLEECTQKLSNFATNIEHLAAIYKANSQVSNIQSSIDSVLKLSSKMSSSRSFSQKYSQWIEDNLIYHINYYEVLLRTIRSSIDYRMQLVNKIDSLTIQYYQNAEKIEEKIQLFEERFVKDWSDIRREFDHNLDILYQKFNAEWKIHCNLMSKIWR